MSAALDQVTDFPALVEYLRDELEWPIAEADFEALTFDYKPEEVGLDSAKVGGGIEIKQLRPLSRKQPWGIFFVNLPQKHLSTTILRTLLGSLAPKKRASSNPAERAVFEQRDLMFIANTGEAGHRHIDFAHFRAPGEGERAAPLQVLGWDADDTERRMRLTGTVLHEKLHWPGSDESLDEWRKRWSDAFREPPHYAVKQSKTLAEEMAKLAKRIRDRANELIKVETDKGALRKLHAGFKEALIHDLTPEKFADYYAQTITYGLFSARVSRPSVGFGHDTIHLNVAGTSPFLKEMLAQFLEVGGRRAGSGDDRFDFDALGVGDVVDLLEAADMDSVLADWDHRNQDEDPVVRFYEDFLKLYDPEEKKKRGVFYTPRPVVSFIVRSIDEVLRIDLGLEDGLASTATWGEVIERNPEIKLPPDGKASDPFVRVLDPATGTGTFLVECVDLIHHRMLAKWKADGRRDSELKKLWNDYVSRHLLPRLTGFELMMAPYAIAHVKLGLKLADTGFTFDSDARAQIYLTNALEPAHDLTMQLAFMSEALAHEARAANEAKQTRFTVLLGNPPYSNMSANLSNAAKAWIEPFRYLDGQKIRERNMLQFERNLNDDYVKFFGYGLAVTEPGPFVIGLITNSSFLWSSSLRGFRKTALDKASSLRIVDLHGASQIGDDAIIAAGDQNVFEIEQAVAVTVIQSTKPTSVSPGYCSVVANLSDKLRWLSEHTASAASTRLRPRPDAYLLRPTTGGREDEYDVFPRLDEIIPLFSEAVKTGRDWLVVGEDATIVQKAMEQIRDSKLPDKELQAETGLSKKKSWNLSAARAALKHTDIAQTMRPYRYRPFDDAVIFYHPKWVASPANPVMQHLETRGENLALLAGRTVRDGSSVLAWIADGIVDKGYLSSMDNVSAFPLWLKPRGTETRALPNIAPAFADRVAELTGLAYSDCVEGPRQASLGGIVKPQAEQTAMFRKRLERGETGKSFGPRDLFDYIYAILHSPAYRERYGDYLKSNFPRVPLPNSAVLFEELVKLGERLAALHLLDVERAPGLKDPKSVRLAGSGDPRVTMPAARFDDDAFENGRMYIAADRSRWFETISASGADFPVGAYLPARKWLKDRAARGGKNASPGRVLNSDEILHYRRMIVALTDTAELMPKIDEVIEKNGGWPDAFRGMTDASDVQAAE